MLSGHKAIILNHFGLASVALTKGSGVSYFHQQLKPIATLIRGMNCPGCHCRAYCFIV